MARPESDPGILFSPRERRAGGKERWESGREGFLDSPRGRRSAGRAQVKGPRV